MITAITGTAAVIDASTTAGALKTVIDSIDAALDQVNSTRATFGATQSRFDTVIANLQQAVENQAAARSRIMDADFAAETANLSPRADPAAGRHRDGGAGQPAAAAGAALLQG